MKELFDWLDCDKDCKITQSDLKNSVGLEILPSESFYFRQDVKFGSKKVCAYEDCWTDNQYNQKSNYCLLHQKVIRNYTNDLFDRISNRISEENWKEFTELLQSQKFIISSKELTDLIFKYSDGYLLTKKDKQFILETFKSLYDDKGKLINEDAAGKPTINNNKNDGLEFFKEKFKQKYI